ncbi:MAG: hypothetical protein GY822_32730 [Deltaproteobacteria bacterium]|nr:hypothetical protein [Deltaproteobacteria bacterium]
MGWLLHQVGFVVLYIAVVAVTAVLPPLGGALTAVLTIFALVDAFYLLPIQTQNAWDRQAHIQDAERGEMDYSSFFAVPEERQTMLY